MDNIDKNIRRLSIRIILVAVLMCTAADTLFFVFYMKSDTLVQTVEDYFLTRVLFPGSANMLAYILAALCERSKARPRFKNCVCAFCLCTVGGSMAIFHGWFVPLWCAPSIAMVYCSVFRDKKLQNALMVYCMFLTAVACLYICIEHPDRYSEYIQNAVVVTVMIVLIRLIGAILVYFNNLIVDKNLEAYRKEREYQRLLSFDDLTQVYSRPYLITLAKNVLNGEYDICGGDNELTCAILDIDNFKSVNDTYGHESGDEVLRVLGSILHKEIENGKIAGRYGGEEFVLLLAGGRHSDNNAEIERLRKEFESRTYDFCDKTFTFSVGTVQCHIGENFDDVLPKADKALYKAKKTGKNKLVDHCEIEDE